MKESQRFEITKEDMSRWITNTKRFFFPALAVYLGAFVLGGASTKSAMAAIPVAVLFLANSAQDLITKWVSENKYK